MRWRLGRRSGNVEDRRSVKMPGRRGAAGGGIGLLVIIVIALLLGADPSKLLNDSSFTETGSSSSYNQPQTSSADNELADFVSVVLADTEDTWNEIFRDYGSQYREPNLVLFSGAVDSACGFAQSAMGPFYCPRDQKVYIDLSFYRDLQYKLGAPGDFAQAYVVAHEVGHHVQNLFGISEQVFDARKRLSQAEGNRLSVMQELQADCFAGVWAHNADKARDILEEGDIEEGLNAASSIGDDRLQKQSQGHITPDSFTHGSSEQRVRWFKTGLKSGDVSSCNTFEAEVL
ncbi:MAG: neutral zinc metallopeptidase [Thermodesulfobacteriota bacterium]